MLNLFSGIRRALLAAFLAMPLASCDNPVEIADDLSDFLIRTPDDYSFSTPVSYDTSPTSTDSIVFQWGPAETAESYAIVFAQAESEDSLDLHQADLMNPTFALPVDPPQFVDVRLNPADTSQFALIGRVVQHVVYLDDLDSVMEQAGLPRGVALPFVWSVAAYRGSEEGMSVERHRMVLTRVQE